MKKALIAILILLMLVPAFSGCEPHDKRAKLSLESLAEYTLVYPATYSEWNMTEIKLLQDTIEHITGTRINAVPDTSEPTDKEIILASSSRTTKYAETVDAFKHEYSYVCGIDGENIVLGGKSYYSDMRAIYDFINNTLHYDDMTGEYGTPEKYLYENVCEWEEPALKIMGSNFACFGFNEPYMYRDFADAGFNVLHIPRDMEYENSLNGVPFRDMLKMCARFGIRAIYMPYSDFSVPGSYNIILPDEEEAVKSPAIWGVYVADEPCEENARKMYAEVLRNAKEKYKDTGWRFYINEGYFFNRDEELYDEYIYPDEQWKEYFSESDAISFDYYVNDFSNREKYVLYTWEKWHKAAKELGQEYYIYIDAYDLAHRGGNTTKMFRSHLYLALCFDCDMAEYFQYGDASPYYDREGDWSGGSPVNYDYTKNRYWYDAQKANTDIQKVATILKDYEYDGIINACPFWENFYYTESQVSEPSEYVKIVKNNTLQDLLCGCYKSEDGNRRAMILMNVKALDNFDYDKSKDVILEDNGEYVTAIRKTFNGFERETYYYKPEVVLDFGGQNVQCYKDGEPFEMQDNGDGTYTVYVDNGDCYLFTME